jgi:hypothetical protein
MAVTAQNALSAILVRDDLYVTVNVSGTGQEVNPGDYVAFSGQYAIAVNTGVAYWKASGVGIALDRNPVYDWAGRPVTNSALLVATRGIFRVSANFSGQPNLGVLAAPSTTGSGVNAPSGVTGVGAAWNTALPVSVSGGTAVAPVAGVAQVVGWTNTGPAGTGQLDLRLWSRNADYY